jgi:hypothetical protein
MRYWDVASPSTEFIVCPCCGYATLTERDAYEICCLCNWEDDGQNNDDADEVRGGPNGAYSLTEARENFRRYWVCTVPAMTCALAMATRRPPSLPSSG